AEALLATPSNLRALRDLALLPQDIAEVGPTADDLVVVVDGEDAAVELALRDALAVLDGDRPLARPSTPDTVRRTVPSLRAALGVLPGANLAVLSVPGPYVHDEAMAALRAGLNLFIFSSNVPVEHEVALKQEATRRGLVVMGPDCGTALLGG